MNFDPSSARSRSLHLLSAEDILVLQGQSLPDVQCPVLIHGKGICLSLVLLLDNFEMMGFR